MSTPPTSPLKMENEEKQPLITAERLALLSHEASDQLHVIWDEMGLSDEERTRQLACLVQDVEKVFKQKVVDEVALRDEYVNASESINLEIDDLSSRLKIDRKFFPHEDAGNLMLKLTWLRDHLQEIEKIKDERMVRLLELQEQMTTIWTELGEKPVPELLVLENFLGLDEIEYYESKLRQLVQDRTRRNEAVHTVVHDILVLFDELGFQPETEFDISISRGGGDLGIDMATVTKLSDRARVLQKEKLARTERLKLLGSQIKPLWDRLHVEDPARDYFFANNTGLGLDVLQHCEDELERLLALKQESMGELLEEVRSNAEMLCNEMCYSPEDRLEFRCFQPVEGEPTDELLEEFESDYDTLSQQVELFRPILRQIEKYEELCIERDDYYEKIQDSSRLLSRKGGSQLREEELQRRRITQQLPRVIEKMRTSIQDYEKLHGKFMLSGARFLDVLEENEREHERLHEERLEARKLQKKSGKEDAMRPASGKTPLKRGASSRTPLSHKNN